MTLSDLLLRQMIYDQAGPQPDSAKTVISYC